jgi:hypothetical protein
MVRQGSAELPEGLTMNATFSINGVRIARLNSAIEGFKPSIAAASLRAIGNNRRDRQNIALENEYIPIEKITKSLY